MKKDKSWHAKKWTKPYVGHDVSKNIVYIGGSYYQSSAQIHLEIEEAKWLLRMLPKAIARANK